MRDILTVIAGVVILLLAAALIAPPFLDWQARRGAIERAIERAAGVEVKTDGRIEVRLLPWPRMRFDGLRLGSAQAEGPSLQASHIKAEIALAPLISGEVRFTEMRVGRAEIRVPATIGGDWRLPAAFRPSAGRRAWAVDDLRIAQLLLTISSPATGRTDQVYAEGVRVQGGSTAGPWRIEGATAGIPFRLAAGGVPADAGVMPVKLSGGGESTPRFEVDGRIGIEPPPAGTRLGPALTVSGSARITSGPPAQLPSTGVPVPLSVQTTFKTAPGAIELDAMSVDLGDGGAVQLTGTGLVKLDEPRLFLKLEGRRLDGDGFLASDSGRTLLSGREPLRLPDMGMPTDLHLEIEAIGLGGSEWTKLALDASIGTAAVVVRRSEVTGPGQTQVSAEGRLDLDGRGGGATGRVAVASGSPDRLVRYLGQFGVADPLLGALGEAPLQASAELAVASPVGSVRDLRVKIGDATLTGAGRYTAGENGQRARMDAQLAIEGLDLGRLPPVPGVLGAMRDLDVGLVLDARNIRYGNTPGVGRIAARLQSDGQSLGIETLEVTALAGANAKVSGRLRPDGSGRIEGDVRAERAAPLVDLLASFGVGGTRFLPAFAREAGLDLHLVAERAAPGLEGGSAPSIRTRLRGAAAGGELDADATSTGGRVEHLSLRLATQNTGQWLGRPEAATLRRSSTLSLEGVRGAGAELSLTATGNIAGLEVKTTQPFALNPDEASVETGAAEIDGADVRPFLEPLGLPRTEAPVPAALRIDVGRDGHATRLKVMGQMAGGAVEADLGVPSLTEVSGTLALDKLSLPWLVDTFGLQTGPEPSGSGLWSRARFGNGTLSPFAGRMTVSVRRVELGRGVQGDDASFTLAVTPDGMSLQEFRTGVAGGRLDGTLGIVRREGQASISGDGTITDAALTALTVAGSFLDGRVTGTLRFAATGDSLAGVIGNLAGSGSMGIGDLRIERADPAAIDRALARGLPTPDPLATGRLHSLVAEELDRAPFTAALVSGPATLVGGSLRLGPLRADLGPGTWEGSGSVDLKTGAVEIKGSLRAKEAPKGWTGAPPSLLIGWKGPIAHPSREIDVAPLVTGVAAVVLQRELEKIEDFESDANERARRAGRLEMDRARKAAEEAARQARIREERAADEAARQVRLRDEAAERARAGQERSRPPTASRAPGGPELPLPTDIRPPAQFPQFQPPGG